MKTCKKCNEEKSFSDFYKQTGGECFGKCKICYKEERLKRYHKDPDKQLKTQRIYESSNKDKMAAKSAKRRVSKISSTPKWADKDLIRAKYRIAQFLTKTTGEEYQVDHVVPLQGKSICGLHVEYNLDVITAKENRSKYNKWEE